LKYFKSNCKTDTVIGEPRDRHSFYQECSIGRKKGQAEPMTLVSALLPSML